VADLFQWLRELWAPRRRRPSSAAGLQADLRVRPLEERRLFHAGPLTTPLAGAVTQNTEPPVAATVTVDEHQNLVIRGSDASEAVAVRWDESHQELWISGAALEGEVPGARSVEGGVAISLAQFEGREIIFDLGDGADSLALDWSAGAPANKVSIAGGGGHDTLTLTATADVVRYDFGPAGSTSITFDGTSNGAHQLGGIETIVDLSMSDYREFHGDGLLRLIGDESGAEFTRVETSGVQVTFAGPRYGLVVDVSATPGGVIEVDHYHGSGDAEVSLRAGESGRIEFRGQSMLGGGEFLATGGTILVDGGIQSNGGRISLLSSQSLTVSHASTVASSGGFVQLDAGRQGVLSVAGRVDTSQLGLDGLGGRIELLGRYVNMESGAQITAEGRSGGGQILIGGDYKGENPLIPQSEQTYLADGVLVSANALTRGNGGRLIIWAADSAIVLNAGGLSARGGGESGDGGFIETSGKRYLWISGAADASAANGAAGEWLLDPRNIEIVTTATTPGVLVGGVFTAAADDSKILASDIVTALNGGTNVTLNTGSTGAQDGDITVSAAIAVTAATGSAVTLTLNAADDIFVNAAISTAGRDLNVVLNANTLAGGVNNDANPAAGNVSLGASGSISTSGGSFSSSGVNFTNAAGGTITTGGGDVTLTHTGPVSLNANISAGAGAASITGLTGSNAVSFASGVTLTAASAVIDAGAITGAGTSAHIDVSGGAGNITLTGRNGIGGAGAPFRVTLGTGAVALNTTAAAGNIRLEANSVLRVSNVTTAAGSAQTVDLNTTGANRDILLSGAITTNDDWTLTATRDIVISGALSAHSLDLNATRNVGINAGVTLSGGDFDSTGVGFNNTGGAIVTGGGAVDIQHTGGITIGDDISAGAGNAAIAITGAPSSTGVTFSAGATLSAGSGSIVGGHVTADAAGTQVAISGAGDFSISATFQAIGSSTTPIGVTMGTGELSLATASATSGQGNIFITAASALRLDTVTTSGANSHTVAITTTGAGNHLTTTVGLTGNDNWTLTSGGNITLGAGFSQRSAVLAATGDVAVNGSVVVSGSPGFSSSGVGFTNVGGSISSSGQNVTLNHTGAVNISTNVLLGGGSFSSSGTTFTNSAAITSTGAATFTLTHTGAVALNEDITFGTGAASITGLIGANGVTFASGVTLTAGSATINAGAITGLGAGVHLDVSSGAGNVNLTGRGGIGGGVSPLRVTMGTGSVSLTTTEAGGNIRLEANSSLRVSGVSTATGTSQTVELNTTGIGRDLTLLNAITTDDDWTLNTTRDLTFGAALAVNSLTASAGRNVSFSSGATVSTGGGSITGQQISAAAVGTHIAVSGAGDFSLTATAGDIGASAIPLGMTMGTGALTLTTSSLVAGEGDIYLSAASALEVEAISTNALNPHVVQITTTGAASHLTISGAAAGNDDWSLTSGGDLSLTTAITQDTLALVAGGNVVISGAVTVSDAAFTSSGVGFDNTGGAISTGGENVVLTHTGAVVIGASVTTGGGSFSSSGTTFGNTATITTAGGNFTLTHTGAVSLGEDISLGVGDASITGPTGSNGVSFASGVTLTAETVTINAGAITAAGVGVHIDVDAGAGNILLTGRNGIGSAGAPVRVSLGTGAVTLTTTDANGDIYVEANSILRVNSVSTAAGSAQDVVLSAVGVNRDIVLQNAISGNDDWSLTTTQDITLGVTFSGRSLDLNAGRNVTINSGVTLSGGEFSSSGVIFQNTAAISTGGGDLTISHTGAVNLDNDLNAGAGATVISTTAASNIAFASGATLTAASASLTTAGAITAAGTTTHVDVTGSGNLSLSANAGIGTSANPLRVQMAGGTLSASTTATGGDIFIRATSALTVGTVTTAAGSTQTVDLRTVGAFDLTVEAANSGNDDWVLNSGGAVVFFGAGSIAGRSAAITAVDEVSSGTAANDIAVTTSVSVIGSTIGDPANRLALAPGAAGTVALRATSGGIAVLLSDAAAFSTSRFTNLEATGSNVLIDLRTTNGLTLNSTANFVGTTNDRFALSTAAGNIAFSGATRLTAAGATLDSAGGISSGTDANADIDITSPAGTIALQAVGAIGASGNALRVRTDGGAVSAVTTGTGGDIYLTSNDALTLSSISTDAATQQTVELTTTGAGSHMSLNQPVTTNDDVTLNSSGNFTLTGAASVSAALLSVTAAGDLRGGTAAVDFTTSDPLAVLALQAASVGTAANAITIAPASTFFDGEATTGDLWVELTNGDWLLANSTFAAPSGATIGLRTTAGNIVFDGGSFAGLSDRGLELSAGGTGDIDLGGSALDFASVSLIAGGAILNPFVGGTAAITSAGNVTLQSGGPIGTVVDPISVDAGGVLSATTTGPTGDIYLRSLQSVNLGQLRALDAGEQTISLSVAGDLTISGAIVSNDNWELLADDNITFGAGGQITANDLRLVASNGAISSGGAAFDVAVNPGGLLSLEAAGSLGALGNNLTLSPGNGDVAVRSQAGDMRLAVVGGDFALSQFNSVVFDSTNHLFLLAVSGGELAVDSNLDLAAGGHSISLSASDDLLFQGALVRGVNIDVHSDAAIVGSASAGDDLQVTGLGGMLNLTSANGIGSQATPLQASLAAGVVVDAATTAAGADIFLTTPGGVLVGSFATNNGDVGLAAQAIGQLLADVELSVGTGGLWLEATAGDVRASVAGDLATSQVKQLSVAATTAVVSLTVDGDLTVNDVSGFAANTQNDQFLLTTSAGNDVSFSGASLQAASAVVTAGGAIRGDGDLIADINTSALNGAVTLQSTGAVGTSGARVRVQAGAGLVSVTTQSAAGNIWLAANGGLRLGAVQTTAASGQTVNVASTGEMAIAVACVTNDNWTLNSGGDLSFEGAANLAGAQINATATGQIRGAAEPPLGVNTADFDVSALPGGAVVLNAGAIGEATNAVDLALGGTGTVSATAAGDIYLDLLGGNLLTSRVSQLQSTAVGADVSLRAVDGGIQIDSLAGMNVANDNLFLTAGAGSIAGGNADPIHAASTHLTASAGIGSALAPLYVRSGELHTFSINDQHLRAPPLPIVGDPLTIMSASSSGMIFLRQGVFTLDGMMTAAEVLSGTELAGRGDVNGLTVRGGGMFGAGVADEGIGRIRVNGDLLLAPGSEFVVDIQAPLQTPGVDFDQVAVTGNLMLDGSILRLRGNAPGTSVLTGVVLIDVQSGANMPGRFATGGSSSVEEVTPGVFEVTLGASRGPLTYSGGDGNDVAIQELVLTPPVVGGGFVPPEIPTMDAPPILPQPPPSRSDAAPQANEPPPLVTTVAPVAVRKLQIRLVTTVDEAGNVVETVAMEIDVAWLRNLKGLLRLVPDDRYRVYLILEGGEERLVLDVVVRGGRAFEPDDLRTQPGIPRREKQGGEAPVAPAPAEAENSKPAMAPTPAGESLAPVQPPAPGAAPAPTQFNRILHLPPGHNESRVAGHAGQAFRAGAAALALAAAQKARSEIDHPADARARQAAQLPKGMWRWLGGK
jgi:hypothetical protein